MSLNLHQFLQQERALGSYRSEGSFTLAVEQARQKLSRYSLPSGEAWVVKLVQAVAGWRVRRLRVVQSRAQTVFLFQPSLRYGLPTGQDIWDTFTAAEVGGRLPLQRFCLALHALRESEKRSFLLSLNDGKGEPAVFADGKHLDLAAAQGPRLRRYLAEQGMALVVSHLTDEEKRFLFFLNNAGRRDAKRRVEISRHLVRMAPTCPMEVELDSRRLDLPEGKQEKVVCIEGIPLPGKGVEPILLPQALHDVLKDEERVGSTWGADRAQLGYILFRYSARPRQSRLLWVDDGAVLDARPLGDLGNLSMTVVVNCAGLPTDLTGLNLVEGEPKRARLSAVKRELRAALESFATRPERRLAHLPLFADRDATAWRKEVETTKASLAASVGWL